MLITNTNQKSFTVNDYFRNLLGIKNIVKDLKSLNKFWICLLIVMAAFFTLDTFILDYGVNSGHKFHWIIGLDYDKYINGWDGTFIGRGYGSQSFFHYYYASKLLNGVTAFVGVINIVLIANRKLSNYFWGVLSCIFYGNYAFAAGYTGDAILNVLFYLPMTFVGYYYWAIKMNNENVVAVNKMKVYMYVIVVFALIICAALWYWVIPLADVSLRSTFWPEDAVSYPYDKLVNVNELSQNFPSSTINISNVVFDANGQAISGTFTIQQQPEYFFSSSESAHVLDASTNSLGVVSTFLMYGRYGQEYILYIIKDSMSIVMWSGAITNGVLSFDLSLILNSFAYLIAAIFGLYQWTNLKKYLKRF